jgi:hypothetical protein
MIEGHLTYKGSGGCTCADGQPCAFQPNSISRLTENVLLFDVLLLRLGIRTTDLFKACAHAMRTTLSETRRNKDIENDTVYRWEPAVVAQTRLGPKVQSLTCSAQFGLLCRYGL